MRCRIELAYASWVIGAIRSGSVSSRRGRLTYPPNLAWLVLLVLWLALDVTLSGYPASGAGVALRLAVAVAWIGLSAYRLVGECLPGSSVLRYMVVISCSPSDVPANHAVRSAVVEAEWERRLGPGPTRSRIRVRDRGRRCLAVVLVGTSVLQVTSLATYAFGSSRLSGVSWATTLVFMGVGLWAILTTRSASSRYRADLVVALGEGIAPGLPPGDPSGYKTWLESRPLSATSAPG